MEKLKYPWDEQWKKVSHERSDDILYEIEDTVVVRRVRKRDLVNRKAELQKQMDKIDADLAKLDELEKVK